MALRTCMVCATPTPNARCDAHAQHHTQTTTRPSAHRRGYTHAWSVLVARVLERDHHVCQIQRPGICLGIATTGDHIIPLSRGGARMDMDNVQAACRPCNSSKGNR